MFDAGGIVASVTAVGARVPPIIDAADTDDTSAIDGRPSLVRSASNEARCWASTSDSGTGAEDAGAVVAAAASGRDESDTACGMAPGAASNEDDGECVSVSCELVASGTPKFFLYSSNAARALAATACAERGRAWGSDTTESASVLGRASLSPPLATSALSARACGL